MTKKDKEMLLFYMNKKANERYKLKQECIELGEHDRANYFDGQKMAFNEMYSFVTNIHAEDE
jgi:hypothetical protein